MSALAVDMDNREGLYAWLMATRQGEPVEELLARILTSWMIGESALPDWLGLGRAGFMRLLARHFPTYPLRRITNPGYTLDPARQDETAELRTLLIQQRSGHSDVELWLADIIIAACLGNDHLWQDLGLWSRADLSKLMREHFAPLAARNTKDMKWKKFLYKQLCETEGIYSCRAPSCTVCHDYAVCFSPE